MKVLKWIGIIIGVLVALIVVAVVVLGRIGDSQMDRMFTPEIEPIMASNDAATITRGKYLVEAVMVCEGCHGKGLKGSALVNEAPFGRFVAPDIRGDRLSVQDFVRAMRHGLKVDGRRILIMPSYEYSNVDDADIGAIYAYARSLPGGGNEIEGSRVSLMFKAMVVLGAFGPFPYDKIDHEKKVTTAPERAVSAEYGRYIAEGCRGCHGRELKGGPIPGGEPGSPEASDISGSGPVASWSLEDFKNAMREGVDPEGTKMDPVYMPWKEFGKMTDDDLEALWLFLTSPQKKDNDV